MARIVVPLVLAAVLAVAACGTYQPYEYVDTNDTITGPGLFTGEDGEWVIFRR